MTTNFLVVGGTGKTGRRVADRLRERGLPVRSTSRRGVPPFDWADRGTWAPVLEGVDAVYLTYYPDLVVPGAAAEISAAAGRDVRYVPVSAEEYAAAAVGLGVPAEEAGVLSELFARVLDGRNESVTPDLERVLGLPAIDFAEFARDAAATGVWAR